MGQNVIMELVQYEKTKGTVQINPAKYFEGISSELWDYHIGGYQVLNKYLKDRKGKSLEDPIHYCRMVTALALTIEIQGEIDGVYGIIDNSQYSYQRNAPCI